MPVCNLVKLKYHSKEDKRYRIYYYVDAAREHELSSSTVATFPLAQATQRFFRGKSRTRFVEVYHENVIVGIDVA
jgi:hypothetical protein